MIQKFNQFDINLSEEILDLFADLEYDDYIVDIKCMNLSKCLRSSCHYIDQNDNYYMTFRNDNRYFIELESYLIKINKSEDINQDINTLKFLYGSVKKMSKTEQNGIITWKHLSIQTSFAEKVNKLLTHSKNIYVVYLKWNDNYSGNIQKILNRYDILKDKLENMQNFNWESIETIKSLKGSAYFTDHLFLYKSIF